MTNRQIVTELDWYSAIYDYIAEQVDGRFRVEFPRLNDVIDEFVSGLRDPLSRLTPELMQWQLSQTVMKLSKQTVECSLEGCDNDDVHNFAKEFIHLIWGARNETSQWLHRQGIVPGQSAN